MSIATSISVSMLIMIIAGCVGHDTASQAEQSKHREFAGRSFTLQMRDYDEGKDNKAKVRLLICQKDTCKNPLLKAGGKEEYMFEDPYAVYKEGQATKDTAHKRLRNALIWGSLLAGLSSVGFYIKSDQTRKVLASRYEELQASVKKLHKVDDEIARLESKESIATTAFYASEIAIVSTALASIITSNINSSGDALKQKLTDLLVHKLPVHVTRSELKVILTHLTEIVPAVIDGSTKENVMNS